MNHEPTKEEDDAWDELAKRQGAWGASVQKVVDAQTDLYNTAVEDVALAMEGFRLRFPGFEPDTFASFVAFIRGMKR